MTVLWITGTKPVNNKESSAIFFLNSRKVEEVEAQLCQKEACL
jgi:hypothetical protein